MIHGTLGSCVYLFFWYVVSQILASIFTDAHEVLQKHQIQVSNAVNSKRSTVVFCPSSDSRLPAQQPEYSETAVTGSAEITNTVV